MIQGRENGSFVILLYGACQPMDRYQLTILHQNVRHGYLRTEVHPC
jgi:hypothetical protein